MEELKHFKSYSTGCSSLKPQLGSLSWLSSVKKKDGDLVATMSRASALQDQLNKSEASLSTALSQNAALSSELADVNSLLAKVCTSTFLNISK